MVNVVFSYRVCIPIDFHRDGCYAIMIKNENARQQRGFINILSYILKVRDSVASIRM
jgi:hypothetical protein